MAWIVIGFTLIALIDLIPILKQRSWAQMAAFLLFFLPALAIAILLQRNVEVPSLMLFLDKILKSIGLSY